MLSLFEIRTPRVIMALVLREMNSTYGRSPGGYAWAVLEPVAGIAVLSIMFSLISRTPGIGTSFPLFYASGLLPFMAYSTIQGKVSQSVNFSKGLLVYLRVTYFDAVIARFLLNAMIQILVAYVVLTGIYVFENLQPSIDYGAVATAFAFAMFLGLGVGTVNCLLTSLFPVWSRIWSIATRPLFLLSGIFFTYDQLPDPVARVFWYNPLIHVVGKMREGIYPTYDSSYVSIAYVAMISGVLTVLGLHFLRRYHKKILNEL